MSLEEHGKDSKADRLDWDEVVGVVKPIISVWVEGSELNWAQYAWGALNEAGMTSYATELERTQCVLRAAGLGVLYLEFCARASDEGSPGGWRDEVGTDMIGAHPGIDFFTLGQLVEREGIEADNAQFDDGYEIGEALRALVHRQYRAVLRELRKRWGDGNLFASLSASSEADVSYPLTEEQAYEIVNGGVTGNRMAAWDWLTA